MMSCKEMIDVCLHHCPWGMRDTVSVYAPANIALCKYWGKRDLALNLPVTDSLSISLGALGSHCTMSIADEDAYFLDGDPVAPDEPFAKRLCAFLDLFRGKEGYQYRVEAVNTVATAAGFASSASGFAAVVMALDQLHGWRLDARSFSIFARMGSGSACRSLWHGLVHWHAGEKVDGSDCYAEPLRSDWKALRVGLIAVDTGSKPISSREAMNRTVATSVLYNSWPQQVQQDMATLLKALAAHDFETLGACAEQNAMAMHATMMAARPSVLYWRPSTLDVLHDVWAARSEGIPVYFTMDAGPNVKVLFPEAAQDAVQQRFPSVQITNPWSA